MNRRILASITIVVFCVSITELSLAQQPVVQDRTRGDQAQRTALPSETPEAVEAVFTNSTPITLSTSGPVNGVPYPSPIVVSGLTGLIPFTPGSIRVTLNNFSHGQPDDVGIVLVSPTGAALVLQDGAGDTADISGVTYTISDTGASQLPTAGTWPAGTYKPASYYDDVYPAPGPGANFANPGPINLGSATFASTFGGTDPNGTWNLYVRDFLPVNSGAFAGGWSLEIIGGSTQHRAPLDFDGDNRTDDGLRRFESGNISWYLLQSTRGFAGVTWGLAADRLVPEDYDGDGKTDVAVFRAGVFYILRSSSNSLQVINFGLAGDDPHITQDFDNDGRADPAVTRIPGGGGPISFYMLRSSLGFGSAVFGTAPGDAPIRGDFDGDGKADVAVYRIASGTPANTFFILPSGGGPVRIVNFGNFNTDYIVPADFDGDHRTDLAVWRGTFGGLDGNWYWLRSSDGVFAAAPFGIAGADVPAPGDYDGDSRTDLAVWRPGTSGAFYHLGSSSGFSATSFGTTTDAPLAALQVR